jgi:hypothetical protein
MSAARAGGKAFSMRRQTAISTSFGGLGSRVPVARFLLMIMSPLFFLNSAVFLFAPAHRMLNGSIRYSLGFRSPFSVRITVVFCGAVPADRMRRSALAFLKRASAGTGKLQPFAVIGPGFQAAKRAFLTQKFFAPCASPRHQFAPDGNIVSPSHGQFLHSFAWAVATAS